VAGSCQHSRRVSLVETRMFELKVGNGNRMHVIGKGGGGGDDEELVGVGLKVPSGEKATRTNFLIICSGLQCKFIFADPESFPLPRFTQLGLGQRNPSGIHKSSMGFGTVPPKAISHFSPRSCCPRSHLVSSSLAYTIYLPPS